MIVECVKAILKLILLSQMPSPILRYHTLPLRTELPIQRLLDLGYTPTATTTFTTPTSSPSSSSYSSPSSSTQQRPTLLHHLDKAIYDAERPYRLVQTFAEVMWILRPVVYVVMRMMYGSRSWKPWVLSLLLQLLSMRLSKGKTEEEKDELSSRKGELGFYLMRKPFSDMISSFVPDRLSFVNVLLEAFSMWHFPTAAS